MNKEDLRDELKAIKDQLNDECWIAWSERDIEKRLNALQDAVNALINILVHYVS